jgi:hypothetical protein
MARLFFFLLGILAIHAQILNWESLDHISPSIRGKAILYGDVVIPDDQQDPDPNSTTSIRNTITETYSDEEDIWNGSIDDADIIVSTYTYLKAMSTITSVIGNFIRSVYSTIYADLDPSVCNSVGTPAEIILDSKLGYSPNKILLDSSDLSLLIPPHSCVLPQSNIYPNGPTFSELRKYMPLYKAYLLQLDEYLECILLYNAYPSYTKGVNCLEEYYYGSQDAGANPPFFDLMANKQDFENSVENFLANPFPPDVTLINATTWTDLQYELDIARQYEDIARKLRATVQLTYTAITRNYGRLERIKYCRTLETQVYNQQPTRFLCNTTNCFSVFYEFILADKTLPGTPLQTTTKSLCENTTCDPQQNFRDPFFCASGSDCPNNMYCSLIDRHCYKTDARRDFVRSFNTTICGYPRRLTDATTIAGTVISAFGGNVNESSLWFDTYWPQICNTTTVTVPDPSYFVDTGPQTFAELCYPFAQGANSSFFYDTGVTNCTLLDITTETFTNVTYAYYIDGVYQGQIMGAVRSINRTSTGNGIWQIVECPNTDPDCITQNDTHVCYHNVQDVLRVQNHLLTEIGVVCDDVRIYANPNNITWGYVDPNASLFPPQPEAIPPGYTNSTYINITNTQYAGISGNYTVTPSGSTVPTDSTGFDYAEFIGYYDYTSPSSYKLDGRLTFYSGGSVSLYVEGKDYFLLATTNLTLGYIQGLAVNSSTGHVLYNPLTDLHPNPRFNDPDECYYLEVHAQANVPMIRSVVNQTQFKNLWMNDVVAQSVSNNTVPILYPCAAIFLRKIVYVQNSLWFENDSTDLQAGIDNEDLRYSCERSLFMSATCSRLGAPMSSSDLNNILSTVNPPDDSIIFQL